MEKLRQSEGDCISDSTYDARYQMGRGIARNMFEPSMRTVPTEEYISQNYNAEKFKTI